MWSGLIVIEDKFRLYIYIYIYIYIVNFKGTSGKNVKKVKKFNKLTITIKWNHKNTQSKEVRKKEGERNQYPIKPTETV